ncbi:hypothetical protein CCACVL1_13886, partial [Corchorus capsularis]
MTSSISAFSSSSFPFLPLLEAQIYIALPFKPKARNHFGLRAQALSSSPPSPTKDIWKRQKTAPFYRQNPSQNRTFLDQSVDMEELLASISKTQDEKELFIVLSPYKTRQLSIRFMVSLLSRETDWKRSLALLDWINEEARYSPSLFAYNVVIRNVLKAKQWAIAHGLFEEMRERGLAPDRFTYSTLITYFGKEGMFDSALSWLQKMENDGVSDTVSYSTLLTMFVENSKFLEAVSVFAEMNEVKCPLDLTTCNIMIDVYGELDMAKEADRLFWSMKKMGIEPNVVSYNTLLKVYGETELFGEAIQLFRLMQRKDIEQNVVTYNTMIKIYGKSLEHEKANNLVQDMRNKGIEPNSITYSTMISIWGKAGKLDRAAMLFQKLRSSGVEIDQVLYQTMIVAYERAGLVGHAKRLLHELKQQDDLPRDTAIMILARAGRIEEATWVFRQACDAGEVKDISVFGMMIDLYSHNKKHANVIEVFEKMRIAGYFPDSNVIALVLNACAKLREFDRAESIYKEMQEEGCIFPDEVHFQMLSLYGARNKFKMVESLFEKLDSDPNINKKE